MKKILLVFALVATTTLSKVDLTLSDAINMGYGNNYDYKNTQLDKKNSEIDVKRAYKEILPKLSYQGDFIKQEEPLSGMGIGPDKNYSHSLNLSQPIFAGGAITAGKNIAEKQDAMQAETLDKKTGSLRLKIIEAYIKALQAQDNLGVAYASKKELDRTYAEAQRKFEVGVSAKTDVLPVKAQVLDSESTIADLKNQVNLTQLELKNLIGYKTNQSLRLHDLRPKNYRTSKINVVEDVITARASGSQAKIAKLNKEIAVEQIKLDRAEMLPQVSLTAGVDASDEYLKDSADEWDWRVGVSVQWNLFDWGQTLDKMQQSRNKALKARNNELKAKDDIEYLVKSNYSNLVKFETQIRAKRAQVAAARENFDGIKKRYEIGVSTLTDYLTYERQLRQAEVDLIAARLSYYYAYESYLESLR